MRFLLFCGLLAACNTAQNSAPASAAVTPSAAVQVADSIAPAQYDAAGKLVRITRPDAEWRKLLSEKEYHVLREEGTEYAFSGDLWNHHGAGTYTCRGCGLALFDSATKFDSGTGWPSYFKPVEAAHVTENRDDSHGMTRVEVECARCGGHLGHVFDDGPAPTGLRYCINSVSLDFVPK
jgi:peptide-methionine (R)-S-oxide reductase